MSANKVSGSGVGAYVHLTISDPWEFGTECGVGPFGGDILDASSEVILLRLRRPLSYQGRQLGYAVARPRHTGDTTQLLDQRRSLAVGLLLLDHDIESLEALTGKESGVAALGAIELNRLG